jgi:ribose transport system substrate-binding protein
MNRSLLPAWLLLPLAFLAAACGKGPSSTAKTITLGLVAKSQSNPVFQAAHAGARAAADELGRRRGITVVIDWQTPPSEDAQKQAEAITQLARGGAAGIAVACSDANALRSAIDDAISLGSVVMTFDSDSAQSKRMTCYGTDDAECGRRVMQELAAAMGDRGTIAILAGNQTAPNLRLRVQGVLDELARHPQMKLSEVFYHQETPEQAAEAVNRAQSTHPEIAGWAMIGGWPLFTKDALRWKPGEVKVVAVDALPAQLDYLVSGHVEVLLAQDCYGWGHRSVELLLAKILDHVDPPPRVVDNLTRVTKADVAGHRAKWQQWLAPR